jgi:XTP/dITP diphosphohydrolase
LWDGTRGLATEKKAVKRIVVIGTRNAKKLREIQQILEGLRVELRTLRDYPDAPEVEETGATFEENAIRKATALADALGEWVMADDSGLEVEALGGRPGVMSARYAGADQDDARNIVRVLAEMKDIPPSRRAARFRCVIALAAPGRLLFTARGMCAGRLISAPRGENGFGYDPIFLFPEFGKTFAELESPVKHQVSHRGRALRNFRDRLESLLKRTED